LRGIPGACDERNAGPKGLRLHWPGRSWKTGETSEQRAPIVLGEVFAPQLDARLDAGLDAGAARPRGRLVHGDALDVASALSAEGLEGKVDLVYVDPPFASQVAYIHEARLDGPADGRVVRATAYDDRWERDGIGGYLDMLAPRLEALAALLAPTGTLWVHVDWRASYLVRVILDEVLGRDAFVNEIVWRRAPNLGRQAASHQFGRTLDTLVVYGRERARLTPPTRLEPIEPSAVRFDDQGRAFTTAPRGDYTDESIARLEAEGRVHRTASGRAYVKYFLVKDARGVFCRERRVDALWTDVAPLRHARTGERTGFPTQKPRSLLDRIIACACPPGGLVVDLFAGSGTTGESAHALGRRFVVGDASTLAIGTARARLLRAKADFVVARCFGADGAGGQAPDPRSATHPRSATSATSATHPTSATSAWPVEARVEASGGRTRVELLSPREPLAWAVDASHDPALPFRTAWHSERAPGARARAVALEALIDRAPGAPGPLAVRVWHDDGVVATQIIEGPAP
jgi:DNA modification methylase